MFTNNKIFFYLMIFSLISISCSTNNNETEKPKNSNIEYKNLDVFISQKLKEVNESVPKAENEKIIKEPRDISLFPNEDEIFDLINNSLMEIKMFVNDSSPEKISNNYFNDSIEFIHSVCGSEYDKKIFRKNDDKQFYKKAITPLFLERLRYVMLKNSGIIRIGIGGGHPDFIKNQDFKFKRQVVKQDGEHYIYYQASNNGKDFSTGYGYSYFFKLIGKKIICYRILLGESC